MEKSGLEPETTTRKVAVLPIKLYPLKTKGFYIKKVAINFTSVILYIINKILYNPYKGIVYV
jgi:hypothetical protein